MKLIDGIVIASPTPIRLDQEPSKQTMNNRLPKHAYNGFVGLIAHEKYSSFNKLPSQSAFSTYEVFRYVDEDTEIKSQKIRFFKKICYGSYSELTVHDVKLFCDAYLPNGTPKMQDDPNMGGLNIVNYRELKNKWVKDFKEANKL